MRRLQKPILGGIAVWEAAALSGYPQDAALLGLGGFLAFALIALLRPAPSVDPAPPPQPADDSMPTPEPLSAAESPIAVVNGSDQTAIW